MAVLLSFFSWDYSPLSSDAGLRVISHFSVSGVFLSDDHAYFKASVGNFSGLGHFFYGMHLITYSLLMGMCRKYCLKRGLTFL